jgi:hypothetical protein
VDSAPEIKVDHRITYTYDLGFLPTMGGNLDVEIATIKHERDIFHDPDRAALSEEEKRDLDDPSRKGHVPCNIGCVVFELFRRGIVSTALG